MLQRPRRSIRQPVRVPVVQTKETDPIKPDGNTSQPAKRKAPDPVDPQRQLRDLLENPKSILTRMDISDLINASTWDMLSEDSRNALQALLPPTAFHDFVPRFKVQESSEEDTMVIDRGCLRTLDNHLFTDSHFLDAAHTFQDHIFSGWLSSTHSEKLEKYLDGIRNGTLAAPWKDEVWERENAPPLEPSQPETPTETVKSSHVVAFNDRRRAGASAEMKLTDLVKDGIILVGDIMAYRRNFTVLGLTVEKDVIVQSIDSRTYALTVLVPRSTTQFLPISLVQGEDIRNGSPDVVSMTICTPQMLETGILDTDGRVSKTKRPHGNAWKCFTVWRSRGNDVSKPNWERGGREMHGTLFYLRGSHFYER